MIRILVAEDNIGIQQIMIQVLELVNCQLNIVENGKKVLEALETASYDLILMDLHMPEMGGLEATAYIRTKERETGKHIPILALTGNPLESNREKCLRVGMDDYLEKPFDVYQLYESIERLLHVKLLFKV